ncbi:hypothetical protein BJ742DRAFT_857542 [Cladochytrium replicatum]|nr:hypothetical protein BJ742DRAFT_857542 [Cladochytrium replicatum]
MSHPTSRGPYLANFGVGFRLNRARARLAPHTSQIDEEGHFWYTESGEQMKKATFGIPSLASSPYLANFGVGFWLNRARARRHPIQAEQKKYTAGFNNQAKNKYIDVGIPSLASVYRCVTDPTAGVT